jgi:hypothetical protein
MQQLGTLLQHTAPACHRPCWYVLMLVSCSVSLAGHETEWGFYRAMIKSGRNNLALLSVMGLLAIPSIAAGVAILQRWEGGAGWFLWVVRCCAMHVHVQLAYISSSFSMFGGQLGLSVYVCVCCPWGCWPSPPLQRWGSVCLFRYCCPECDGAAGHPIHCSRRGHPAEVGGLLRPSVSVYAVVLCRAAHVHPMSRKLTALRWLASFSGWCCAVPCMCSLLVYFPFVLFRVNFVCLFTCICYPCCLQLAD